MQPETDALVRAHDGRVGDSTRDWSLEAPRLEARRMGADGNRYPKTPSDSRWAPHRSATRAAADVRRRFITTAPSQRTRLPHPSPAIRRAPFPVIRDDPSCCSPKTSSTTPRPSPSTASSRVADPSGCATGCCTPPALTPAPRDDDHARPLGVSLPASPRADQTDPARPADRPERPPAPRRAAITHTAATSINTHPPPLPARSH